MAADVELVPVAPFYRLDWPDGSRFDYSNDEPALRAEIARFNPADVAGYERFLDYAKGVYREGYVKLGSAAFLDMASMLRAAPALMRHRAWRSVYRSEEHTSELQSLMRISYAVFCLKKKKQN